jgi:hypothetical protein
MAEWWDRRDLVELLELSPPWRSASLSGRTAG